MTDDLYVENKVHYYGNMVLIVQTSMFDIVAQYIALTGVIGLLFSWLVGGLDLWKGIFYISLVIILVSMSYLSSKFRFYLLRWRINKVVDKNLKLEWLSKEQVVNRFIQGGLKPHGTKRNLRTTQK